MIIVFFKQKTGYEMRISDWSSDVCSSDLIDLGRTEIARVDLDDAAAALLAIALLVDAATLEAQVDASIGERPLDEGADVRRFARRKHIVVGRFLLQHPPPPLDIFPRIAPVELGVELPAIHLVLQPPSDSGPPACALPG